RRSSASISPDRLSFWIISITNFGSSLASWMTMAAIFLRYRSTIMADHFVRSDRSGAGRVHLTGSAGESLPWAEQRAYDRLRIDRTLRSKRTAEQNADRSMHIDLACCRHGALLQEKKGTPVPVAGEQRFPARDTLVPDGAKGFGYHARCRARKEKGPRSL